MADYEGAIKRPFSDLKKLLIGVVLSTFPIISLFAKGYYLESSGVSKKRRINRKEMPDWENWSNLFFKGLLAIIIKSVYLLPMIFVMLFGFGFVLSSLIATLAPIFPFDSLSSDPAAIMKIENFFQQNWMLIMPSLLKLGPFIFFGVIFALLAVYISPIAILSFISSNKLSDAFDLRNIFKKAFTAEYFVAFIVIALFSIVIKAVFLIIPFVGMGISKFLTGMFAYTVIGEIYKKL